jgi:1-deoxy-D-xylulose-5-phosphate synthase
MKFKVLDRVDSVEDLRQLNINELKALSQDVRKLILHRVGEIGGHLSSNLGVIEATLAIHYVFDTPKDKLVFDVSHQCYTHKIITGRKHAFIEPKKYPIAGFTNKEESEFDIFNVGHTSTSISLATGLAKARDMLGEKYRVVAFIGDGSLSGLRAWGGCECLGG